MKSAKFYVYLHKRRDTGEVFYVGKGCGSRANCLRGRNLYWNRIYAAHGRSVEIVAYFWLETDALAFEQTLIAEQKALGVALANLTNGGEGECGWHHSEEAKKKMKEAATGRTITAEVRAKLSAALKGREVTEQHRRKLSEANLARFSTPEGRKNASECQIGRTFSPEHRANLSASRKGKSVKPPTAAARLAMSEAQKRRFTRPEEIAKLRLPRGPRAKACEVLSG